MTHQIAGVGLAAVAGAALDVPTTTAVVLVGAAWVGSMVPDADMAGSRVYRRTRVERRHLLARALGALVRLPLRLLVLLPHRGFTHSLAACAFAAVAVTALAGLVAPTAATAAGVGLAVGYGAHIAADACTPSGVPLLAPVSKKRHHLLPKHARIPTGSLREYAAAAVLTATLLAAAVVFAA